MSHKPGDLEGRLRSHLSAQTRLAQAINIFPNPEKALASALEIIADALEADHCFVLRYDKISESLIPMLPAYGFSAQSLEQFKNRQIELNGSPSVSVKAFSLCQPVRTHSNPYLSEMAAPLTIDGRPQAVVVAVKRQGAHFDNLDEECLSGMAATLAILLRNGILFNNLENEKRRHIALLEVGVDGFVEVDRNFKITHFSKGAEELTGWKSQEAIDHTCQEVLLPHSPENDLLCARCPLKKAFQQGTPVTNVETLLHTREGDDNWVSCSYNAVVNSRGEAVSGVIAIKDIHRTKARDEELRQQIQQLESLQGVIDAISGLSNIEEIYRRALFEVGNSIEFDLGLIHSVNQDNQGLHLMTKFQRDELDASLDFLLDLNEPETIDFSQPAKNGKSSNGTGKKSSSKRLALDAVGKVPEQEDHPGIPASNCSALVQNEPYVAMSLPGKDICHVLEDYKGIKSSLCVPIKTQDYTYGVLHLASYSPFAFKGSDFTLALGISKQIAVAAERARLFNEVHQLARTDQMTGLYNKREFWDRLEKEMRRAERQRRPLSLMMIDLDRLKWFNDFYGHAKGDELLAKIGEIMQLNCRATDVAFRYGGDELCLLLADTLPDEARNLADRIRAAARQLQMLNPSNDLIIGAEAIVTMSIGIASFPGDAQRADILFERADAAMFRAKQTGKDRVCIYDSNIDNIKKNFRQTHDSPAEYKDDRLTLPTSLSLELEASLEAINHQDGDSETTEYIIPHSPRVKANGNKELGVSGMEEVEDDTPEEKPSRELPGTVSRG